jgi:hypothetical protein
MEELVPIEIDLNVDPDHIDESFLRTFGFLTNTLLKHMFAGHSAPAKIRGTPGQVASFTDALGKEKRYMNSFLKHGLNDERTLRSRSRLMQAVSAFERETGLRWPYSS